MKLFLRSRVSPSVNREFGQRVHAARRDLYLTQPEFAARCGVSLRTIQRWEQGYNYPHPEHLRDLAAATGRSIHWLVAGEERRAA